MLLKKIIFKGLFGIYNHEVELFNEGISIIIGQNGIGKTYILDSINAFFNKQFSFFENLDYDEISFIFDDNVQLDITTVKTQESSFLEILNSENKETLKIPFNELIDPCSMELREKASYISRCIPHIQRIGPTRYLDLEKNQILDAFELVTQYDWLNIDTNKLKEILGEKGSRFFERLEKNSVYLIGAHRIYTFSPIDRVNKFERNYEFKNIEKIKIYAEELKGQINVVENSYSKVAASLDESFPYRLINLVREHSQEIGKEEIEDISNKLSELDERRKSLKRVGLLDNKDSTSIDKNDIDLASEAIKLYIKDSNLKFDEYENLKEKISLFMDIINKRFNHKKLLINKDNGFEFIQNIDSEENKQIPMSRLSSGEKNELILFFELIFKSRKENLVLIDEPEISLHISWQNLFVEDLKRVHELIGINVLIATHSPDIINTNWLLTNDLIGGR